MSSCKTKHYARQEFLFKVMLILLFLYGFYFCGLFLIHEFKESLQEAFILSTSNLDSIADSYEEAVSLMGDLR